ncbi:Succinyl-CoA ligase [ADP-forming] subunit alpha [Novipirellula aureliae]|uniref:Succinyl-CoA ligase [ADP-forming] subunit alpha n=1 Tax=Novipirellula aureliae TaxID=2527966 RepID=A0A5C6E9G1_9BACT|nr:bifunctional acetate--CoA ligase family protein/GNAT family N-acetyltransferase [Novipirellula aureliae]TWU45612.1 Succinyl-CoA ligase [ADP-forming] subunit alpha [Novipirellula aureliae]
MSIRNLDKIFAARHVAIVGATPRESSVGRTVIQNLIAGGYQGEIFPVNPRFEEIERVRCYSSFDDLPQTPDLAVIAIAAANVPDAIDRCGQAGIRGIVVLSAGFREVGKRGQELEQEILTVKKRYDNMRIVGPNCLGIISPHRGLNASFASDSPPKGRIAFISQSGALCTAVLDWAIEKKIGFSYFVSVGNMLDVGMADLIDYFSMDQYTDSIILYVESITDARRFMSAARAFTRSKPIIAYKAGRFTESALAAASHTGAMMGVDSVYEAAFARAGIVRVFEVGDLFDCAALLARKNETKGPRLAIVTNAGGPGVMATDALLQRQGTLATLSKQTLEKLVAILPSAWSHGNPIDILGDAPPQRYQDAIEIVLQDDNVDGLLVILSPQAMTAPVETAKVVLTSAKKTSKPVLAAWMGGVRVRPGMELMSDAGLPVYRTPEKAVSAFMYLVEYARRREILYETPRSIPVRFHLDQTKMRSVFEKLRSEGSDTLSEVASKTLLEAYNVPTTKTLVARSSNDAVTLAKRIGYPVVMKIFSPEITHKSEVGGVILNLTDPQGVADAFGQITLQAKQRRPDACIEGVTLQSMVTSPNGRELIVGAKRDPVFGSVLLIGAGGTMAEIMQDSSLELPPLSETLARRMIQSLRAWPMLGEFRGKPAVHLDRLVEVLMRISYLVANHPQIKELDINPLLVTPEDAVALDCRIILDRRDPGNLDSRNGSARESQSLYPHLAIRPYPSEFREQFTLSDHTPLLLRPIAPEDEPQWCDLVASCSPETLRMRFRYMFKATTHEMATRFCFTDYDRELAIAAEIQHEGKPVFVGVGRLVADVDHREAEFAVLVSDKWQGHGIGAILTDYCLQLCKRWKIQSVVAEMSPANQRMIDIFSHRDFKLSRNIAEDVVIARKKLV